MTQLLLFAFVMITYSSCDRRHSYPPATQRGPDIIIDASTLEPDVPQFFSYPYQGRNINYFILKIDKSITSFLDACASCYSHKQGYRCEDGSVTCRYCNMKFSVYKLEKGMGSCYPIKIEGRMEDGKYLIPVAALEAEAGKF